MLGKIFPSGFVSGALPDSCEVSLELQGLAPKEALEADEEASGRSQPGDSAGPSLLTRENVEMIREQLDEVLLADDGESRTGLCVPIPILLDFVGQTERQLRSAPRSPPPTVANLPAFVPRAQQCPWRPPPRAAPPPGPLDRGSPSDQVAALAAAPAAAPAVNNVGVPPAAGPFDRWRRCTRNTVGRLWPCRIDSSLRFVARDYRFLVKLVQHCTHRPLKKLSISKRATN